MNEAKYLSETIGVRVAGTRGEYEASEYLESCFKQIGLKVINQKFSFLNWEPLERPHLTVLSPERLEIDVAPMGYTLPTPTEGISGHLKKIGKMSLIPGYIEWEKFVIVDDQGFEAAFLVKKPEGCASPFPTGIPLLPEPGGVIGKDDAERLISLLSDNEKVKVRFYNPCKQYPATSRNIIGILGEGDPEIVVTAHYDTVFYAPGAVDNASGIQAMIDIARELKKNYDKEMPTIAFAAMGCEEPGLLGSRYYVKYLKEHEKLSSVKYCVNFDMIGKGSRIVLRTGVGMKENIERLADKFKGKITNEIFIDTAKASSDNWPFEEQNIPNMQFVSLPFNLYHLKDDMFEHIDSVIVSEVKAMGLELIKDLASKL